MSTDPIIQAAELIASADALHITAGAGMGVDSGLPDFRGGKGFWEAYPALANAGIEFRSIANPSAFKKNPRLAWGFYGHRLELYRNTVPHDGFRLLKLMAEQMPHSAFVTTSNVDGQFQKAGFEESRILEVHGSIHRLQCTEPCRDTVWSAEFIQPRTNDDRCEWIGDLPTCNKCRKLARPNILMFNDWVWMSSRTEIQQTAKTIWVKKTSKRVVIELGAGVDIPTIRYTSQAQGCPVIRINTRHPQLPEGMGVSLPMGAKDALSAIAAELKRIGWMDTDLANDDGENP